MDTIVLPFVPNNYYGRSTAINNIDVGDILYIGDKTTAIPTKVKEIICQSSGYTIITEDFKLVASLNTRVGVKVL